MSDEEILEQNENQTATDDDQADSPDSRNRRTVS